MNIRTGIIILGIIFVCLSISFGFCSRKGIMIREHLVRQVDTVDDIIALFPKNAAEIMPAIAIYIEDAQKDIHNILAISDEKRTFENTALKLDRLAGLSDLSIFSSVVSLLEVVSPDEKMRNVAHDAVVKVQNFYIDQISNNKKLYEAFKAYAQGNALKEELTAEQRYFISETMDDFVRAGLDLPDEKLQEVKKLKKELAQLTLTFDRNIAADKSTISVDRDDLKGLEKDFIDNLERTDDGNYILGVDYPTFFNVLENCAVEDTRRKLMLAFINRAYPKNDELLKQIIAKRDQIANIIGFDSYAQLDLDNQMVKNPSRAYDFLHDLLERASKKEKKEFARWTADLPESVTLTQDKKIKPWDLRYLQNQYKKKHLAVDEQLISHYFPMEKTVEGLLAIYKQFLSINFQEVPVSGLWHDDVKLVKVYTKDRSELLGYLFLDLFPRPNKYSHAAHAGIIPAVKKEDGTRLPTVSVVLANFPKSTSTKPSLLKRSDVETFFHEFGHALHAILGATDMASFSGTSVKRDFVELPSQMLEEWLWDKKILQQIGSHYETGEPLSDELIDNIIALKQFNSGYWVKRQVFYSLISLDYFARGADKDPYTIWQNLKSKIDPDIAQEKNDHSYAAFNHLTGYGAKYYGYLWSKVFALDLFDTINKHGLLNADIGSKYVRDVIGKGGSQDPNDLLQTFLGREPKSDAFFKSLGI